MNDEEKLIPEEEQYCSSYDMEKRCCTKQGFCYDNVDCQRYHRVAEYENTGLSPIEIEELKKELKGEQDLNVKAWEELNNNKYYKQYVKDWQERNNKTDLYYPSANTVYKDYIELKGINKNLADAVKMFTKFYCHTDCLEKVQKENNELRARLEKKRWSCLVVLGINCT